MHFIPSVDFSIEIFRFIRVKFALSINILQFTEFNNIIIYKNTIFNDTIFNDSKDAVATFRQYLWVIYVGPKYVDQSPRRARIMLYVRRTLVPPTLMN